MFLAKSMKPEGLHSANSDFSSAVSSRPAQPKTTAAGEFTLSADNYTANPALLQFSANGACLRACLQSSCLHPVEGSLSGNLDSFDQQ